MVRERMERDNAEASILARDEARIQYFRRFFEIEAPDAAEHYHLVINTSEMNLDAADRHHHSRVRRAPARASVQARLPRRTLTASGC